MTRYLTFKIVLHNRQKNLYALVTPSERDQRQRKQINRKTKKKTSKEMDTLLSNLKSNLKVNVKRLKESIDEFPQRSMTEFI